MNQGNIINFGVRLKEARQRKGFTQSDVAKLLEFKDHSAISRHENNQAEPDYTVLLAYSKLYDVSLDYLFGLEHKFNNNGTYEKGTFGKNLQTLRRSLDLKQEEMAEKIHIDKNTYSMYEQEIKEPDYVTLVKIADYFKVTVDELLGRNFNSTNYNNEHKKEKVKELLNKLVDTIFI